MIPSPTRRGQPPPITPSPVFRSRIYDLITHTGSGPLRRSAATRSAAGASPPAIFRSPVQPARPAVRLGSQGPRKEEAHHRYQRSWAPRDSFYWCRGAASTPSPELNPGAEGCVHVFSIDRRTTAVHGDSPVFVRPRPGSAGLGWGPTTAPDNPDHAGPSSATGPRTGITPSERR
jgi:hypothetical protein